MNNKLWMATSKQGLHSHTGKRSWKEHFEMKQSEIRYFATIFSYEGSVNRPTCPLNRTLLIIGEYGLCIYNYDTNSPHGDTGPPRTDFRDDGGTSLRRNDVKTSWVLTLLHEAGTSFFLRKLVQRHLRVEARADARSHTRSRRRQEHFQINLIDCKLKINFTVTATFERSETHTEVPK